MQLITLTTDFGLKDHRLASLKGQLFGNISAPFCIVDISHEVTAHNLVEAAFLFESAWKHFPEKTIHIIWLYPHGVKDVIVAKLRDHWMIAPDNGFLSLLDDSEEMTFYKVTASGSEGRHIFSTLALVCAKCMDGEDTSFVEVSSIKQRIALQPVYSKNEIRASFLYADRFGNVYFNLKKHIFNKIRDGKPFRVFYKGMEPLTRISESYAQVPPGEMLCMFNEAGFFQISQNLGSASEALEMKREDSIQILFYE